MGPNSPISVSGGIGVTVVKVFRVLFKGLPEFQPQIGRGRSRPGLINMYKAILWQALYVPSGGFVDLYGLTVLKLQQVPLHTDHFFLLVINDTIHRQSQQAYSPLHQR